jgi:hypothetical protein
MSCKFVVSATTDATGKLVLSIRNVYIVASHNNYNFFYHYCHGSSDFASSRVANQQLSGTNAIWKNMLFVIGACFFCSFLKAGGKATIILDWISSLSFLRAGIYCTVQVYHDEFVSIIKHCVWVFVLLPRALGSNY